MKSKDRILLTAKPSAAALRHLETSDKTKAISKKGPYKKHVITDKSVRQKSKSHRLVVPTYKLK